VFFDQGENELTVIGRQLDAFLRQVTYVRRGDGVYMESMTEDEMEAVDWMLRDYRKSREENKYMFGAVVTSEEYDALEEFLDSYREKNEKLRESSELEGQISMFDE